MVVFDKKPDDLASQPEFGVGFPVHGARVPGLPTALRYGIAVVAVFCALAIRLVLVPVVGEVAPYLPFTMAVMIAARFGGRAPGFVATIASAGAAIWFLLEPRHTLYVSSVPEQWGLALFLVVGCAISFLIGNLHTTLRVNAEVEASLQSKLRIIDMAHDAIIATDSQRRALTWNRGAVQLYGWTEAEVAGRAVHDVLKTTNHLSMQEVDDILLREGQWEGELHHVTREGREIVTDSRQILMRSPDGSPVAILEINRDITDRKRAADKLRENESLLRAIMENIPEAIFLKDRESRVILANPGYERAMAKTGNPIIGKTPYQYLFNPMDAAMVLKHDRRVIEGAETLVIEENIETTTGRQVFLSTKSPWRDAEGSIIGLVGVSINVTDRKRAEEHRALALEAARMGSWEYQIESDNWILDEMCERLYGGTESERVTPDEARRRIHPEDVTRVNKSVARALSGMNHGAYHEDFRVIWPDGSEHWIMSHGRVSFEGEGEDRRAVRFMGVSMDITARQAADKTFREKQKLESIGVLAGGVAHDFNNLLTVITGNASDALEECPSCAYANAIVAAADRAANLTRQLMAYAGKGGLVSTLVNLSEVASSCRELLSSSVSRKVQLQFNLAEEIPCFEADPSQIEQVLMNLVINAGEAIPQDQGGLIQISTGARNLTPEMASRHSVSYEIYSGRYSYLEVKDNGNGMDEKTLARIFEPFFSTKFTGRGLGLAAVYGIVRNLKGFIEVESSPGAGTTIVVSLPGSDKKPAARPALPVVKSRQHAPASILVVDDEEMVCKLASRALTRDGYQVLEAHDGREALEVLAQCPSLPALVVLDLAMPVMGGNELVPILHSRYPGIKVLLTSGYPEDEARRMSSDSGVAGFLQKPYTPAALAEKIDAVLNGNKNANMKGQLVSIESIVNEARSEAVRAGG